MQQRDEVQVEKVLEQEEGELSQEELPNTSNESSAPNQNNNRDTNTGEVSETTPAENKQQIDKPLCRYFARGICRYGENCRYSHDDQVQQNGQGYQNGVSAIVPNVPNVPNGNGISSNDLKFGVLTHPRSSTPCRFFAKGYCRYGDDCKFAHNSIVIPNGNIVHHHPHPPSQYAHYQQQPYGEWSGFPPDGDNNVIKPWDEDSQEVLDAMHQQSYY